MWHILGSIIGGLGWPARCGGGCLGKRWTSTLWVKSSRHRSGRNRGEGRSRFGVNSSPGVARVCSHYYCPSRSDSKCNTWHSMAGGPPQLPNCHDSGVWGNILSLSDAIDPVVRSAGVDLFAVLAVEQQQQQQQQQQQELSWLALDEMVLSMTPLECQD